MATSSTSKKIQRVQRAGVTRSAGQRRPLGFPAAVVAIIVVGTVLVLWARDARLSANAVRPVANEDTWFAAFGVYVCDEFLPAGDFTDVIEDTKGIQANGDGLIRIAPTSEDTAGNNAVLGQYFNAVGLSVADTGWTHTPVNGPATSHQAGEACTTQGEDGSETQSTTTEVKLLIFPPQASDTTKPEVAPTGFAATRFADDGQAFVLALVPADADVNEIGLPPSVSALDDPNDDPPGVPEKEASDEQEGSSEGTTTTAPGATTTIAPGATTTTTAG